MKNSLKDKVIIITGASGYIGSCLAKEMGKEGAKVVACYRESRKGVEEIIKEHKNIIPIHVDVRDASSVKKMVKEVMGLFEAVDVLINNAAIRRDALTLRMKEEEWEQVLSTNLKGVFLLTKEVASYMARRRSGHIINVSSYAAIRPDIGQASYAASKSALLSFTKTAALEFSRFCIRVNAVIPPLFPHGLSEGLSPSLLQKKREVALLPPSIKDFVEFMKWLILSESVTAQVFCIDSRI
jgi:3-oxoacyl-[acyl-carrier protein] reductase